MKIQKIKVISLLCFLSLVLTGIALHKNNCKVNGILKKLQEQILSATNEIPGFEDSISKVIKDGAAKLAGDKEKFKKLMMTMDDDRLSILSHLVIEYDPSELIDTINIIQKYWGTDHKPIIELFQSKDDVGRSALFFAVLRKKSDMLKVLLEKAQEIFGDNKKEFLIFINGENQEGQRELLSFKTPFILAAYNDDIPAVILLLKMALKVFGKGTQNFKEFLHARDDNGATAAFYARDETKRAVKKIGITLSENDE